MEKKQYSEYLETLYWKSMKNEVDQNFSTIRSEESVIKIQGYVYYMG